MRRHPQRSRTNQDRWLISYADFVTLLFGFFVVLYAFSKADRVQRSEIVQSLNSAFNDSGHARGPAGNETAHTRSTFAPAPAVVPSRGAENYAMLSLAQVREDFMRTRRDLEQSLSGQLASHAISIYMSSDGLVISLREAGFFASGSATPDAQTLPILRQVAASLARTPFDLRIEGHTDNVPMHSATFDSNWELSTARATSVARMILGLSTVSPDRISAAGYAGFRPTASNDTEEGRAENRRVDLVLVPRMRIDFSEPAPQASERASWRKVAGN